MMHSYGVGIGSPGISKFSCSHGQLILFVKLTGKSCRIETYWDNLNLFDPLLSALSLSGKYSGTVAILCCLVYTLLGLAIYVNF